LSEGSKNKEVRKIDLSQTHQPLIAALRKTGTDLFLGLHGESAHTISEKLQRDLFGFVRFPFLKPYARVSKKEIRTFCAHNFVKNRDRSIFSPGFP